MICVNCLADKDVSEFHKRRDTTDGYKKECRITMENNK